MAVNVLGANYAKKYGGQAPFLSVQQLVSCSQGYGNHGCNGGHFFWAWDYAKDFALELDSVYPYVSGSGEVPIPPCEYDGTGYAYAGLTWYIENSLSAYKDAIISPSGGVIATSA